MNLLLNWYRSGLSNVNEAEKGVDLACSVLRKSFDVFKSRPPETAHSSVSVHGM